MSIDTPDFLGITAIHHGHLKAYTSGAQVIAPGANFSSGPISVFKPGYLFWLTAQMAALAANPFVAIAIQWSDGATGEILDIERWAAPAGTPGALRANGRGQVKGDTANITITNLDAAQNCTVHFTLFEESHSIARDDLRSQMNNSFTTSAANTTFAKGSGTSNTLIQDAPTVLAGATAIFVLPLYSGQVNFSETDNGAGSVTVTVAPTQLLDSSAALAPIVTFAGAATGGLRTLGLPRQPCSIMVVNSGGAAAIVNLQMVAVELAS